MSPLSSTLPSIRHGGCLAAILLALTAASSAGATDLVISDTAVAVSADRSTPGPLNASAVIYDGLTGAALSFTGSTPRTFMGQGFSVADTGGPVQISSMQIALVVASAQTFADTRINVEFWDAYDSSGASGAVFSTPLGINSFTTGPISTTGATALSFTLNFATPISLTGLANHGLAVNWQSDAAGTGSFIDNTNLTTALRTTGSAAIATGANVTPSSGYYRNASGLTNFNFLATDGRVLTGVTNGGLAFSLAVATAVPEPGSAALLLMGGLGIAAFVMRRRRDGAPG